MENGKPKLTIYRHIAKSITYRIYSSSITFLISYGITGKASLGLTIGVADFFIKIGTYFIHERVWYRINFGKKYLDKKIKEKNDN
jgi:uncharacterized membrane protein